VGYGDIYACSAASRWAVIAELTNTITIGLITLPALTNLFVEVANAALVRQKAEGTQSGGDGPLLAAVIPRMLIICLA